MFVLFLVGYIFDWCGLKFIVMLLLVINVIGNVLYGFFVFLNLLYVMFFGWLIVGIGVGFVIFVLVYLINMILE